MSTRTLRLVLGGLVLALVVMIGVTIGVVMTQSSEPASEQPTASATTALGDVSMMTVPVPANAECAACHKGADLQHPNVPVMGHPLEGWSTCSSCHGQDKLVATAAGHSGIHADECLLCHRPPAPGSASALPRPHHVMTGQACTTCHGVNKVAPLPSNMQDRKNCWVCHSGSNSTSLFDDASAAPTS